MKLLSIGSPKGSRSTNNPRRASSLYSAVSRTVTTNFNTKPINSDIDELRYLYKDEFPVNVEIWDSVGIEKHNELFVYTQGYVKGKHGIFFMIDGS